METRRNQGRLGFQGRKKSGSGGERGFLGTERASLLLKDDITGGSRKGSGLKKAKRNLFSRKPMSYSARTAREDIKETFHKMRISSVRKGERIAQGRGENRGVPSAGEGKIRKK